MLIRKTESRTCRRQTRGFALAAIMLILFLLMAAMLMGAAGNGAFYNTTGGVQMSSTRMNEASAFNLAESGSDYARLWFTTLSYPPVTVNNVPFAPFTTTSGNAEWGATINAGTPPRAVIDYPDSTHTFSVTVYPIVGSSGSSVKNYLIESIGTSGTSKVILHVQIQLVNFAKYAFFDDNDRSGGVWGSRGVYFEGPYHSNNSNGVTLGFNWYDNNQASPLFQLNDTDSFSFSGDPVWDHNWQESNYQYNAPPQTASQWEDLTAGGQQNMTYGFQTNADGSHKLDSNGNPIPNSPRIPLPTADNTRQYAALGQTIPTPATSTPASTPTTVGVTLYANGGIYIHADTNPSTGQADDVQTMVFSALPDSSGNKTIQQILITQPKASGGSTITQEQKVTINPGANTTTVQTSTNGGTSWTTTQSVSGTTNGVIYADCNIGSETTGTGVSGTIADNVVNSSGAITHYNTLDLTTDLADSKNITAAGSLVYNTARNLAVAEASDSNFLTHAGTIGFVTNEFYIPNDTGTLVNGDVQLEFDATIFAKDTFCDQSSSHYELNTDATVTVLGGVIEENVSKMHSNGGYIEQYHYDVRLANLPPPYFPTTGNKYNVLSWQRVATTLE